MKQLLTWSFLILLLPTVSLGATESIVLNGLPIAQSKGNIQESQNFQLAENLQNEYRLLISKIGDKYFWKTRENRPLLKQHSGDITIFIEASGAGYVRVSEVDGRVLYMEHMAIGFQTVTYWGIAENFAP